MINRRKRRAFCVLWALFQIVLLASPSLVTAQEETPEYTGVDIVFLVDQSGSMRGENGSDPHNLRFSGLQQMVERLAGYRIHYFHDSDIQFQIAVVYFTGQVERVVEPTIIDPDNSNEWKSLSAHLQAKLSPQASKIPAGDTDHWRALTEAKSLLQEMEGNWDHGEHVQAILMLTDGDWYLTCPGLRPAYCQGGKEGDFLWNKYREDLGGYIDNHLPYPRYRLYVGAINDPAGPYYWPNVRGYWKNWTHDNAELLEANTMWAFFEEILAEMTVNEPSLNEAKTTPGDVEEIKEDQVPIPPYLQKVTFVIHKPEPSMRVKMYQDGQLLDDLPITIVEDRDQFIESITLLNPEPGYIIIERPETTSALRIFMIKIVADVTCDPLSSVPQFIPVRLQCTVSGRGGLLPLYNDPRFSLTVEAEIQGEGTSQRRVLIPEENKSNTYTADYLPSQPGEHTLTIVGSTHDPDGEPFELFRRPPPEAASFVVKPSTARLEFEGTPTALLPALASVMLVDADGVPLQVPSESAGWVQMRLTLTGADQTSTIELAPSTKGYQGTFTLAYPGSYQTRLLGQIQDPATGQYFTAFDENMGAFEVLPPRVIWQGFSSPWLQYKVAPVDVSLVDAKGDLFGEQIDPDWRLTTEVWIVQDALRTPVDLAMEAKGHWSGEFTPQEAGDFDLIVSTWATSPEGKEIPLLQDALVSAFTIEKLYPQIAWQGFSSSWPQYKEAPIAFSLTDQKGISLAAQIDSTWRLRAEAAIVSDGSREPMALRAASETADRWSGEFVPQESGEFDLVVTAWAETSEGEKISLLQDELAWEFTISQMTLVRAAVLRPAAQAKYAWRDFLWRPRPLEIEIAILDKSGSPLSPSEILQNPAEPMLEVEIVSPEGRAFGPLALKRGIAPNRFLASFDQYGTFDWYTHRDLGWYEVTVRPMGNLGQSYIYEQPKGVTLRVHLSRHAYWWTLPALLAVLFVVLLVLAIRQVYLYLWSMQGTLRIEGAGPIWTRRLSDYGKHKLTFGGRDSLPAGIRKVAVSQSRGQRNPPIEVTVHLKRGKSHYKILAGARKPLGGDLFLVYERGMGAGSTPGMSLSRTVLFYGLVAALMLLGLGGTIFALLSSLG